MKRNLFAGNFICSFAVLILLLSACVPQDGESAESTSSVADLVPAGSVAENLEDMPTRTPVPTPTPGPIDSAV